jgi:arylsulfatase A-like enzyme
VEHLQAAGYHTVNIGKMHTVPLDTPCGFDQRFVVENKDRPLRLDRPHGNLYDEWDKFLNNNGVRKPSRHTYEAEDPVWATGLGAFEWPLEERYHPDVFVGTMAKWFIEQRQTNSPLFLQVGFPGPHPPYDPPRRFLELYREADLPVPDVSEEELAAQPPPQSQLRMAFCEANHDAVCWNERPSYAQLLRLRRHYAANVSLIDEQIGEILEALERRGYLENAIVVFTSDHGDALGDHGHTQKWTMYDVITRVPTIVWAPGRIPGGKRIDYIIQQMDLATMLFELADVEMPSVAGRLPGGAAVSALPLILDQGNEQMKTGLREAVFAEHTSDMILKGVELMTMVRTKDWKLVHYLNQNWGELYNLEEDTAELHNLWNDPSRSNIKRELLDILRDWRIRDTIH